VHRFYQEQYQLNNGAQNLYTTGSDAVGLTQGYYDTKALPIYQYLHGRDADRQQLGACEPALDHRLERDAEQLSALPRHRSRARHRADTGLPVARRQ
jgi:hypothetical protein